MNKTLKQWLLKPWLLVVVGIVFNILSAIITHYFIGLNNQQLNLLEQKVNNIDTLIDSQWRNKTELERKQEFLLILLTQRQDNADQRIQKLLQNQLDEVIKQYALNQNALKNDNQISFGTITSVLNQGKQQIISHINDSYLEKLDIEARQQPLKQTNTLLLTVAIFLQVTGLILVLARDILR